MKALKVYVDDELAREAQVAAKADGRKLSQWVAQLIRKALSKQ